MGREGEPRRNPQDRAAGEPDPRDEPADDRGTRAACSGGPRRGRAAGGDPACRGREAGADPVRRGPSAGGTSRRRGAGGAGARGGRSDADGVRGGHAVRPGRAALLHRDQLRAGVPGAGIGAEHAPCRGADGILGARRRHRAGDAVDPRRRRHAWERAAGYAAAHTPPPPPPVVPPPVPPVAAMPAASPWGAGTPG